jgi:Zn-dependent M28 family amino/carboxypeptidase
MSIMNNSSSDRDDLKTNLRNIIAFLSHDIGSRSYVEHAKLERSAAFIEEQFKKYGCKSQKQPFRVEGHTYYNIFTEIHGTGSSDEILVIGAHYDTVSGTPGADDNASGVAGMLELSRLIQDNPIANTACLVAFCLEEPPFFRSRNMGSYVFAKSLKKYNRKVMGMISLEMIGYFRSGSGSQYYPLPFFRFFYPKTGDYIAFVGNLSSRAFTKRFEAIFKKVSSLHCESLNTTSLVVGIDFSDHRSFWHFNYPAFMITDTAFYRNPNYHGPGDTGDTLDYEKITELVLGMYKTLSSI